MNQKGYTPIVILLGILFLAIVGGTSYYFYSVQKQLTSSTSKPDQTLPVNSINIISPTLIVPAGLTIKNVPINEGQIALIENGKLELLDTSNWQKKIIPKLNLHQDTSDLSFSRDGNTLFTSSDGSTFYIYNLLTDNLITIPKMDPNPRVSSSKDVSPDGKYLVLTQSCCPGDVGRTIMTIDGKVIKTQSGGMIVWSSDSKSLAISKGEVILNLGLGPEPQNSSVYLERIDGSIVTDKLLIKATNQQSYSPISWIDNNILLISKTTYQQPFPDNINSTDEKQSNYWMNIYENSTVTYLTLDVNSLQIKDASYSPPPIDNFPLNSKSAINISYSPDNQWRVYTQGTSVVGPSFISKIDGSNQIKISDNAYVVWKPQ